MDELLMCCVGRRAHPLQVWAEQVPACGVAVGAGGCWRGDGIEGGH